MTPGVSVAHYRVTSKLGEGGMGEVWRATDTKLGRDVAIKILPENFAHDPDRMARFKREAQVLASLNHPHIAAIYGVEDRALIMELVEGPTLAERLMQGPMPVEEALPIARQIAEALEYAHAQGIVHRDLKPANIKLGSRMRVLDFGLAKVEAAGEEDATMTSPTFAGAILGTAAYMSPEQAMANAVDARSDVFSFGLVLYEMLAGRRAFSEKNTISTMAAILHKQPPPLRELAPGVPAAIDAVVSRCLEKDPAARFPGMGAVRKALESTAEPAPAVAQSEPKGTSIAVLPFANLSVEKENEYFSDGLTEEILNALGGVAGLRVVARASAFACRGCTIREAGERLRVNAALMGSVRRAGNRIRVVVQLVDVADETQIWSERYDREMTDVFAVQDEISQAVVDALRQRLACGGERRPAQRQTSNLDAYHLFLKGRYHFYKMGREDWETAKRYWEEAAAADPDYAMPRFELAHYYFGAAVTGQGHSRELVPLALQALDRAIALDPGLGEARALRGLLWGFYERRWHEGLRECERALELNPTSALIPQWRGHLLMALGRTAEAIAQQERAVHADPFSALAHLVMGQVLLAAHDWERAERHARQAIEISPRPPMLALLGYICARVGKREESLELADRARAMPPGGIFGGWRCGIYVLAGERERAIEEFRQMESAQGHVASFGQAVLSALLGDADAAFEHLNQAYEDREFALSWLPDPAFDGLRSDARYADLTRRMNIVG